jgi:hypothetical protein
MAHEKKILKIVLISIKVLHDKQSFAKIKLLAFFHQIKPLILTTNSIHLGTTLIFCERLMLFLSYNYFTTKLMCQAFQRTESAINIPYVELQC